MIVRTDLHIPRVPGLKIDENVGNTIALHIMCITLLTELWLILLLYIFFISGKGKVKLFEDATGSR